jgi:hypothetical protein
VSYPNVVSISKFRTDVKAFANETLFPDDVINFWLMVATAMVDPGQWGEETYLGIEMFTAHHVVLDVKNNMDVSVGSLPGLSRGAINSESVGPVSIGYDTASTLEEDAGNWNYTIYGQRYIHWARQYGAAVIYIGAGCAPPFSGPAWAGPWTAFLPNPSC